MNHELADMNVFGIQPSQQPEPLMATTSTPRPIRRALQAAQPGRPQAAQPGRTADIRRAHTELSPRHVSAPQ